MSSRARLSRIRARCSADEAGRSAGLAETDLGATMNVLKKATGGLLTAHG